MLVGRLLNLAQTNQRAVQRPFFHGAGPRQAGLGADGCPFMIVLRERVPESLWAAGRSQYNRAMARSAAGTYPLHLICDSRACVANRRAWPPRRVRDAAADLRDAA